MSDQKLTKQEKSWILYDWANSAYSMVILSSILSIYFTTMVGDVGLSKNIATSYWGYSNSIASLIVALLSPIMGGIADYMGVKKKFFTVFAFLGIIFTALLAFIPYGNWQLILVMYIISLLGFSLGNVFYDSFLTDISTPKNMDKVSSLGYAYGYIGGALPFILCMILIIGSQKGFIPIETTIAIKISFIITAIWWLIFTIPMFKNIVQKYGKTYQKINFKSIMNDFKSGMKKVYHHKKVFTFLIAYFFYIDGVGTIIRMASSFATAIGIDSTTLLMVLLAIQFIAFPFAILYNKLSYKYGTKTMIMIAIVTYIIISIIGYFMTSAIHLWILAVLVGSAQGGIQALSRSYFANMIPKENSNEYFGYYNIFGKFAAVLGPFLMGSMTQITDNPRIGVFSIIFLFVIGGILFVRSTKITNDFVETN